MTLALPSSLYPSEATISEMARTARCPKGKVRSWLRDTRKRAQSIQGQVNVAVGRRRTRDITSGRFVVSTIYEPMRVLSNRSVDAFNEEISHVQEMGVFREADGNTYLSVPTHTFQSDEVNTLNRLLSRHVYPVLPKLFRLADRDVWPSVVDVYVFSEGGVIGVPNRLSQEQCMYGIFVQNLNDEDMFVNGWKLEKGHVVLIKTDYVIKTEIKCANGKQRVMFIVI